MNLTDRIRGTIDALVMHPTSTWGTLQLADALRAVLDLHAPMPMYGECEHRWNDEEGAHEHELLEIEPINVPEIGESCENAFEGNACRECCADDEGNQTAHCAEYHGHGQELPYCSTVQAIAVQLGIDVAPTGSSP